MHRTRRHVSARIERARSTHRPHNTRTQYPLYFTPSYPYLRRPHLGFAPARDVGLQHRLAVVHLPLEQPAALPALHALLQLFSCRGGRVAWLLPVILVGLVLEGVVECVGVWMGWLVVDLIKGRALDRGRPAHPSCRTCLHERPAAEEEGPGGHLLALRVRHGLLNELCRGEPRGGEGAHERGEGREARDWKEVWVMQGAGLANTYIHFLLYPLSRYTPCARRQQSFHCCCVFPG